MRCFLEFVGSTSLPFGYGLTAAICVTPTALPVRNHADRIPRMTFEEMLAQCKGTAASDLFIKVGCVPSVRVDGKIRVLQSEPVSPEFPRSVAESIFSKDQLEDLNRVKELDTAHTHPEFGRFRVNAFFQQGHIGLVLRRLMSTVRPLEELNLPAESLKKLVSASRGLFLVSGPTGCGKTTALASMIEHLNQTQPKHIVTLEDPIEYIYKDKKCIINQREIGRDTSDFYLALKHCVRQSPDVILIGEMRDRETMEAATAAAETGHFVLSTLHTINASRTLERIMNFFPADQHAFLRHQLAMNLVGILSLRLIRLKAGRGRVPAFELMVNSPTIKDLLLEGRVNDLTNAMKEGRHFGSMTFNQCLLYLFRKEVISLEEALAASDHPDDLNLEIRGISKGAF